MITVESRASWKMSIRFLKFTTVFYLCDLKNIQARASRSMESYTRSGLRCVQSGDDAEIQFQLTKQLFSEGLGIGVWNYKASERAAFVNFLQPSPRAHADVGRYR
jgi:hypothetical protein